jgi:hypothetical protein
MHQEYDLGELPTQVCSVGPWSVAAPFCRSKTSLFALLSSSKCFFDHRLTMAFLTMWGQLCCHGDHRDPLLKGGSSCCLVAAASEWGDLPSSRPKMNPSLRVTHQLREGSLIASTAAARATLGTDQGKGISLVAGTSQKLGGCDWDLDKF